MRFLHYKKQTNILSLNNARTLWDTHTHTQNIIDVRRCRQDAITQQTSKRDRASQFGQTWKTSLLTLLVRSTIKTSLCKSVQLSWWHALAISGPPPATIIIIIIHIPGSCHPQRHHVNKYDYVGRPPIEQHLA